VGDLVSRWTRRWAEHPAAAVLFQVGASPSPDAGRWVRAGEIDERSAAAAAVLRRAGVGVGDRVLWAPDPSVAGVVGHVAALRAGAVVVPVNPAYTERELRHVVEEVTPAAALIAGDAMEAVLSVLDVPGLLDLHALASLPAPGPGAPTPSEQDATARGAEEAAAAPALVAFTSGTTGAPKGAVLSHGNVLANSWALATAWGVTEEDRLVHALPLFHGHGLCAALYTMLLAGASTVLLPGFDAGAVGDAVGAHRASLFFGVPTMYHRLLHSGAIDALRSARLAVSGSAPLSAEMHRAAKERGVDVLERYGMTETLLTISNPLRGERRAGTVGFPLPGIEAEVDDASGEILVRGPQVFEGYLNRPAATAESFADGWFHTGDLAEVEEGYVRIRGRAGDLVISGGFNVYPAEVEDVLLRHPGVAEVAVTGTPSEEWGEVVTAWVVLAGAAAGPGAERDLLDFAAAELAPYKRPRLVHFVDALPRNAMGKVQRSQLR